MGWQVLHYSNIPIFFFPVPIKSHDQAFITLHLQFPRDLPTFTLSLFYHNSNFPEYTFNSITSTLKTHNGSFHGLTQVYKILHKTPSAYHAGPSASAGLLQFTAENKPSYSVFSIHTWSLPILFLSDCYPPRWYLFSISGTVILMKFILIPRTIYSFSPLNLDSFLSPPWH